MHLGLKIVCIMLMASLVVDEVIGCWAFCWRVNWQKQKSKRGIDNNYGNSYKLRLPCGLAAYDTNGDGAIDENEFAKAGNAKKTDKGLKSFFALVDSNDDGKLSVDEQINAIPKHCRTDEIAAITEKL